VDAGVVRLRKVTIAPSYLANVAEGDSVQFVASGDVVLPLTWSTSSAAVGTIDAAGMFRALAPGFVIVGVTDGEGKKDSTSVFNVVPSVIKSLTLWVPDTSRTQTLEVAVPVRVTTVTGLGITSAQFRLTFNTSHLEYLGVNLVGGMAAGWGTPVVNDLTPGTLDFALAGSDTLTGAGTLFSVRFRVKQSAVGSSTIGLANARFNETITPALDSGTFTVIPAPLIKVNTSASVALKGETVTVPSVTGGTSPFTYSSSNPSIATVDPSTGTLTVLTRGPVLILTVDAQGFPGKSDTIRTYDFRATVSDTTVVAGDSVEVPLIVGSTDGLGIVAYQFRLAYDTSKVIFRGVVLDGTLSAGFTPVVKDTAGVLDLAAAGATPLTGAGTLAKLRFAPNPPSFGHESAQLALSRFVFNEPGDGTPLAYAVGGTLTIVTPNASPVFLTAPPDTTVPPGKTLQVQLSASDPDGDTLRYRSVQMPAAAVLDSVTGLLTWAVTLADSGDQGFVLRVTDGVASDTTSFTVHVPSAIAPTFAYVTTLAVPGVEYRRRVVRNGSPLAIVDPVSLPVGMIMNDDTLIWTPTEQQIGFHRVVIEASNIAGSVWDTTDILVEAVRSAENQLRVDFTNRGKVGAFGQFGKGIWYKGKNASGAADFSLVDRNSVKYAGGLYSTLFSFSPDGPPTSSVGFVDTTSRFPGFTAFRTTFSDRWEPAASRIGVNVCLLGYVKSSAPDDHYVIAEYNIVNSSGSAIDDLFAQMTADFDIGNAASNWGGYEGALGLSYAHEQGGGTDASYYGVALLSHPVAGHAVFVSGSDGQYVRSVANLTTFPALPGAAGDTRNQLTAGPFTLSAGDTLRFGVAFLAADDLTQLQSAALQARTIWGSLTTSVAGRDLAVPAEFDVSQNYPNPFNPSTVIRFGLPTESRVSLTIYDQLGREVSTLVNGSLGAGMHEARWDASGMASGLYFFRIEAVGADGARFVRANKMVLMK
jgi:hypothetical protein